jgi:hypothetical protein
MYKNYLKRIMGMDADELELFVDDWMGRKKKTYVDTEVWAGSGDKGRDVACYLTDQRLGGPWHLFQCKQLRGTLSLPNAKKELGKVFYYAANGAYAMPERYVFVAPQNASRPLKELLALPEAFRRSMLDGWDEDCAKGIVEKVEIPLSPNIQTLIESFDFGRIFVNDALRMLKDPDAVATMVKFFGHDPGDWSAGKIPIEELPEEAKYLHQLIAAYGQRAGMGFSAVADVVLHGEHRDHLVDQRERY